MAKATITTKSGVKIRLEGAPEEIRRVLDDVRRKEGQLTKPQQRKSSDNKGTARATDGILALRDAGFFDRPKSLVQVKQALEEQGMIYPVTSLSGRVLELVRRRLLGRVKQNKMWHYVKR